MKFKIDENLPIEVANYWRKMVTTPLLSYSKSLQENRIPRLREFAERKNELW